MAFSLCPFFVWEKGINQKTEVSFTDFIPMFGGA